MTLLVKDANTQTQSLSTQADSGGNLVCVNVPASVVGGVATPASLTNPLPVQAVAMAAAIDGSSTITVGGTAQLLFGGVTPTNGYLVANPNASDVLWINEGGTALANGVGSIALAAAGAPFMTPPGYKPFGAVSIVGPNTGDKFTARRW